MHNQRKHKIIKGIEESLNVIPDHKQIKGITRYFLSDNRSLPGKSFHISYHAIDSSRSSGENWQYSAPHSHDFDEINLIISQNGTLKIRYELDKETEVVESPSCIYIPAGVEHRSEAVEGEGIFVCIWLDTEK